MSKRVLILANSSLGLCNFRSELISGLMKRAEVTVVTPDSGRWDDLQALGCTIIETPLERRGLNPAKDAKLLAYYFRLLRKVRPDLVITYTIKPNIYGGLACCMLGIPYAANITGLGTAFQSEGALRRLVTVLYRQALRKAKVVLFENQGNAAALQQLGIVQAERCCVLHGAGVNLTRYTPADYPAGDGPTRFLFVGRLMREKGVDELLAAMERLWAEGVDCTLDVLGDLEEDYAQTLRRAEEAGWLRYHGYQPDVRPYIAASHCFVLPSYHEGMANTNLECAAMARPLITSRIPGCMEAVKEGVSGFLCTPKDADSLYGAMKRFTQLDADTRRAMGLAARAHVAAEFDKEQVVNATMEALGV